MGGLGRRARGDASALLGGRAWWGGAANGMGFGEVPSVARVASVDSGEGV
jgi:hypothetical protein